MPTKNKVLERLVLITFKYIFETEAQGEVGSLFSRHRYQNVRKMGRRVPTSITRALLQYHAQGHWLASLQLCSFLNEQRVRLCPEHLFIASDVIHTHRSDLSADFARTFCVAEQQPSLVGLLAPILPSGWRAGRDNDDVLPLDYVCENLSFVARNGHHLDGLRLVRNCVANPDLLGLLSQRLAEAPAEVHSGSRLAIGQGVAMLSAVHARLLSDLARSPPMETASTACVSVCSPSDTASQSAGAPDPIGAAIDAYCDIKQFASRLVTSVGAAFPIASVGGQGDLVEPSEGGAATSVRAMDAAAEALVSALGEGRGASEQVTRYVTLVRGAGV